MVVAFKEIKFKLLVLAVVLAAGAGGCWWPFTGGDASRKALAKIVSIQVYAPDRLRGAGIAAEPFRAGQEAEASPELDRVALIIIRGFAEENRLGNSSLKYIVPQEAEAADLVIDGHIDVFVRPGLIGRSLRGDKAEIRVTAEVRDRKTGDIVAVLRTRRWPENEDKWISWEAYDIGVQLMQRLGEYAGGGQ